MSFAVRKVCPVFSLAPNPHWASYMKLLDDTLQYFMQDFALLVVRQSAFEEGVPLAVLRTILK